MSNHLSSGGGGGGSSSVSLSIPEAVNEFGVTLYVVQVVIGEVRWTVRHRYRDFAALHETLIEAGVSKESLPQKRFIGNRDPSFIMKRRRELEVYVQSVFQFLQRAIPESLAEFLHLTKYDVIFVLRGLAASHFDRLQQQEELQAPLQAPSPLPDEASWTPLEMFSVSEMLKSPLPPQDPHSRRADFTNVADRACQLSRLKVQGSNDVLGSSNIVPNSLKFDFFAFKSLSRLSLHNVVCSPKLIGGLGKVRSTLQFLQANKCGLTSISEIFLCDTPHEPQDLDRLIQDRRPSLEWPLLEHLDLRYNAVERIDCSVSLAPALKTLLMGSNKVKCIENLTSLAKLNSLELADNLVSDTDDLNVKLGQVTQIDLSHNKVSTLAGFSKLYSLHNLNVSANRIKDLEAVFHVSNLPCLEVFNLQGNLVTALVDYRLKVFESFGKRCVELCLDNETPSQPEVDKVSVLMALRVAREGRSPTSLFGNLPRRVTADHM